MPTKLPNFGDAANRLNRRKGTAKRSLDENEWAFHRVPSEQICACSHWEFDRHRGVERLPWLSLSKEEQWRLCKEFERRVKRPFREVPLDQASITACWITNSPHVRHLQPVLDLIVEVDFSAKDDALKNAFKLWLEEHPERERWQRVNPNKPPNKRPWRM
jgi:hypothetical protein